MSATTHHSLRASAALRGLRIAALAAGVVVCLGLAVTLTLLLAASGLLSVLDLTAFIPRPTSAYALRAGGAWGVFLALASLLHRTTRGYGA